MMFGGLVRNKSRRQSTVSGAYLSKLVLKFFLWDFDGFLVYFKGT